MRYTAENVSRRKKIKGEKKNCGRTVIESATE